MRLYLWGIGIFSFLYYFLLVVYSRRWKTTFVLFWPLIGTIHFAILFLWKLIPTLFQWTVEIGVLIFWVFFLFEEFRIIRTAQYWKKHAEETEAKYLIVLGAQIRGTYITKSLLRRLEAAQAYLIGHSSVKVIVSGGRGRGETITEAEAMSNYLQSHGISKDRILKEEKSTSTKLNFRYSAELIDDKASKVIVVTNDFHLYRALRIGKKEGYLSLCGIAADSNPILYLNYITREFFALIWMILHYRIE